MTDPNILWGSYSVFEGPFHSGSLPYRLPSTPDFLDKALATITATEGGTFDAYNGYDRCKCSIGPIQWGEVCSNGAVTQILLRLPKELIVKHLEPVGVTLVTGRFVPTIACAALAGSTGYKGQWSETQKIRAKAFAAAMVKLCRTPEAQKAMLEFTKPRLLDFALPFGVAPRELFKPGFPEDDWEGALRAGYLSFAANLPAVAARRAHFGIGSGDAKTRCITLLRELTFGPGIAIYPGRYAKIRPVLERLFDVDLPDAAVDLRVTPQLIQQRLIDLGYDLGPAGADGKMGVKTQSAVRTYQQSKGLKVDGLVGPQTLTALGLS